MVPVQDREQQEFSQEFAQESGELPGSLEPDILTMEQLYLDDTVSQGQKDELINSIFRLFHSIKGAAGSLKFQNISQSAHSAENLLDGIRTGELAFVPDHVDVFCSTWDFLREAIGHVDTSFEDESFFESAQLVQKQIEKELLRSASKPKRPKIKLKKPVIDMEGGPVPQIDPETLKRFLQESEGMVDATESSLLSLAEKKGDAAEHLATVFRSLHSLRVNAVSWGFQTWRNSGTGWSQWLKVCVMVSAQAVSPPQRACCILSIFPGKG
ncbi:MAG: Hpt domain-containing protein [Thermodesulfobacteriota bacterium]